MAPLVDVCGLRYRYPESETAALDGIDLVLDGGLCTVAGPSGGGKSTLLRLLNGLVPHMYGGRISGRAHVAGLDVLRTPTRRLATSVGFVFQDAERQAVHTTVERDVAYGLENLGVPRAEMHHRVDAVLERLAIGHLRGRTVATLSGGERQRAAVAGALVLQPRLLVLDEPLAQLDEAGACGLLEMCRDLRDTGTAVVIAEHRLDTLLVASDVLVTVSSGSCAGPAPPLQLAAGLASAPQVVRLSAQMGWDPPLIDPAEARLPAAAGMDAPRRVPCALGEVLWELESVGTQRGPLGGVSLAGRAGEVLALLGANGSGKTTLLRVIAGLASPDEGRVRRSGARVAYLPQNPGALLHRESVAAEVAWSLRGQDGDAGEVMALLGVAGVAGSDPRDLSSGQRQRAAVAVILAGSPAVALLDEPTRGMDGRARDGLVTAIRRLAAAGSSVVIATHDTDLAALVADRVAILEEGTVRDRGDPESALSGPHPFATQLGRRFDSPGPVTVEAVAALLRGTAVPRPVAP